MNYTSEDFDKLGRKRLLELFDECGIGIFYHVEETDKGVVKHLRSSLIATYFRIIYHVKTIRPENPEKRGTIYYYNYDKGMYFSNAIVFFREFFNRWWKDKFGEVRRIEVWDALAASTYIDRDEFTLDSKYIPVENGILELVSNDGHWALDFIKNTPNLFVTTRIFTKYIPGLKPKRFMEQLQTTLPNKIKAHSRIQEWFGTCLHREQDYDYALLPVGDGDNGKTTLLSILRTTLGHKNTTNIGLHTITYNRFAGAMLEGKLANIGDDLSRRDLRVFDKFLKLTGGSNQFTVERKGVDFYPVTITAKHAWPGNELPHIDILTTAFLRRWLIVNFDVIFTNDEIRKNKIMNELTTPEELSGILNWGLEGLLIVLNNDKFTYPPSIEENRATWRSRSANALVRFMFSSQIVRGPENLYLMSDLITEVNDYALRQKLGTMSGQKIGATFNKSFPEIQKTNRMFQGKQTWFYKGIKPHGKSYIIDDETGEDARTDFK